MRSETDVDALFALEIRAQWTRVYGSLEIEPPAAVHHVTAFGRCTIGAFTYTNHNCEIFDCDIGRYCSIGQNVIINPGHHPTDFLTSHPVGTSQTGESAVMHGLRTYQRFSLTSASRPIRPDRATRVGIASDVWIGAGSIITKGVQIGLGAIVGAGSVVSRDVPPFAIVAGVPARLVRYRLPHAQRTRITQSEWWRYDLSSLRERDYSDPDIILDEIDRAKAAGTLALYEPERVTIEG